MWRSCISTQFEVLICCGRSAGGECGVGKRSPDCKFAFATLADIERWRAGISTNYGRDTGLELVRLNGCPLNSLEMYGMKSLPSVLDVKTDRIDQGVSAGKHVGNCPFVVNVDLDRLKLGKYRPD